MATAIREDVYKFCKSCQYLRLMRLGEPEDNIYYCSQNTNKKRKNADIVKVEGNVSFDLSEEFELPDTEKCPCALEFLMRDELS
jgi:hypothetical protein